MPNIQQTKITEILNNIAMSCRMEGLELTDEIRAMCLAIYNGSTTLQDCLIACIRSMRNTFETHLCQ